MVPIEPTVNEDLSPIVIFVYNRPEHTNKLLESLMGCEELTQSKIYVFSDGPKDVKDGLCVEKVREAISDFAKIQDCEITKREVNIGLASSVITGVAQVLQNHTSVIVLEDDLVVSKDFLRFMNWGLRVFKSQPRIFSLTGYSFPNGYFSIPAHYENRVFLSPRCGSWSWATWRDRWEKVDWDLLDFEEFASDERRVSKFNEIGWDLSRMLELQRSGGIDSWAIRFCYAHFKSSAYCLHPVSTLVHNAGLDRTGTHGRPDQRFVHVDELGVWCEDKPDEFVQPNSAIIDEVSRIFAGRNGPLLSRLRGTLSRSAIGRCVQLLDARKRAKQRSSDRQ